MIKDYRVRELIHITRSVDVSIDETLESCFYKAFDWANKMGLQGVKVSGLYLKQSPLDGFLDPLNAKHTLSCLVFDKEEVKEGQ